MVDRDVEPFNRWAPTYERGSRRAYFARLHRALLGGLEEQCPTPHRVLDVGCGTGALLRAAAARWPDAVLSGADPAEEMVRVARGHLTVGTRIELVCAAAESLPFADASFDLVLSTVSFHHWTNQATGLAEVARVLAPGGRLCLADHFAVGLLRPLFAAVGKRERMHSGPEVEDMLEHAGLQVLSWRIAARIGPVPFIRAVTASIEGSSRGS